MMFFLVEIIDLDFEKEFDIYIGIVYIRWVIYGEFSFINSYFQRLDFFNGQLKYFNIIGICKVVIIVKKFMYLVDIIVNI